MEQPLLLDLFCGVGGAAMGYHRAGFDVIGVDKIPQPEYPFPFYRADISEWTEIPTEFAGRKVDAIHASPPCKIFSTLSKSLGYPSHTDLLTPTRELLHGLNGSGIKWIIENVPGAPMKEPIILCGSMEEFNLVIPGRGYLQRHRLFESNVWLMTPGPCRHGKKSGGVGELEGLRAIGVYGRGRGGGEMKDRTANAEEARMLMGIDWAGRDGVAQAVPPAYTEWLGKQLLSNL